jgi:hypothetical protein
VAGFLRAFTSRDPVALVIRLEPPAQEALQRATAELGRLLDRLGIPIAAAPEVQLELTRLPPARRGSLYTAAQVFLRCPGPRDSIYAREAAACGLVVVDGDGAAAPELRALAAAMTGSAAR